MNSRPLTSILALALGALSAAAAIADDASPEKNLARVRAVVFDGKIDALFVHRADTCEYPWITNAPACAVVLFTLTPTPESAIHARLLLPPPEKWDGRFWGVGNQDVGKDIADWLFRGYQLARLRAGSATCCADMGTADGRHGREVVRDFGWRAQHLMSVTAKAMIAAYYGKPSAHNYFVGISSGGGQGLHEAQRFPEDYDGIVSYVPAHDRFALALGGREAWKAAHDAQGKLVITRAQCRATAAAARAHFASVTPAPLSGKAVVDPTYDEKAADAILDLAAKECPELKDADLRARWKRLWRNPTWKGRAYPGGRGFGANLEAQLERRSFMRRILYGEGGKAEEALSDDEFAAFWSEIGPDVNALSPDLERFAARGGKLIVVSGLADSIVTYRTAEDWCERVAAHFGGAEKTRPFLRAYFLPGRDHGWRASIGDGVADVNAIGALLDWCERGKAPEGLHGRLKDGTRVTVDPWPAK